MVSPEGPASHNVEPDGSLGPLDMTKPHRDRSPSDPLAVRLTSYNVAGAVSFRRGLRCGYSFSKAASCGPRFCMVDA